MAHIKGTNRGDDIYGTNRDDWIVGKNGDDVIHGSDGDDHIDGGKGWDVMDYTGYQGRLSITLNASGKAVVYGDDVPRDKLVGVEEIIGGSGDDYFVGSKADNIFSGGAGHDYFVASKGSDVYRGGDGYDMIDYSDIKDGLRFKLDTANGTTIVRGGDTLDGVENVIGTNYADVIKGDGANNYFLGMGGDDKLSGGAGGDVLNGGKGDDRLAGGADADIFEFVSGFGEDVITDFQKGDLIDLSDVATMSNYEAMFGGNRIYQDGDNVYISAGKGDVITIENVDISDLCATDFLF